MWLDNASEIDMLFYEPYASIISDMTKETNHDPMTIGVFGLWGAGKSTLLNLIQDKIKNEEKIICVQINAWMFEGYEDAKTALMEALLKELKSKEPFNNYGEKLKGLLKRLDYFKIGTSIITKSAPLLASIATANPLQFFLNIVNDAGEMTKQIQSVASTLQKFKEDNPQESVVENIRMFRNEFENLLESAKVENIVVLVDDLDRCNPERIIDSLEAIKLFLSVNRTTFIIAADDTVIQYAIKTRYPVIENSDVELSKEYIEKMIQLPIYIPELSPKDIENYLILLVVQKYLRDDDFKKLINYIHCQKLITRSEKISLEELKVIIDANCINNFENDQFCEDALVIDGIRGIVSSTLKGNPRQAKRFLNTFITKKQLALQYYERKEIDFQILAKLLVLQKIDSDLFKKLNDWNKNFAIENEEFKEMYTTVTSNNENGKYKEWSNAQVKSWLNCNPVKLYEYNLDKYFYLTRENLGGRMQGEQKFVESVRKILETFGNMTSGKITGTITKIKELTIVDRKQLFEVLLNRVEKGEMKTNIIRGLYTDFEEYQDLFIEKMKLSKQEYSLGDIPPLKIMYKKTPEKVSKLLNDLTTKRISDRMYKDITGKDR